MRRTYLTIILVLALTMSALAVEHDLLVSRQVDKLTGDLSLTAEQAESIRTILTEQVETALSGEKQSPPDQQQPGNRGSGKDVRKKIHALLNEDQQTAFRELDYQIVPSRRLLELNERLDLDEDQVVLIEEILATTRGERRAMQPEGADKTGGDREAMKQMHDQQDSQIEEILTDDQKALFAQMKEERKQRKGDNRPPRKPKG